MTKQIDWEKVGGLLPVVVQEIGSNEVLMLAFMNHEALKLSLNTRLAHYYSRTKKRIWKKGESSGNIQKIHSFFLDCDNDTLLIKVEQVGGVACHTGQKSCFFTPLDAQENSLDAPILDAPQTNYDIIDKLYHIIKERTHADPKTSYVAKLLSGNKNSLLKKIVEEAGEFCFACKDKDEEEIIYECADVAFHLLVALQSHEIHPDRIRQELARRFGLSGIEEKKQRNAN